MGLDMYLYTKKYMSKYNNEEKAAEIRALFPEVPKVDNLESVEVKFEVGYWRKANHIHKWFVENVQEGEDDCGEYYVSREDLMKLKDACINTNKYLDSCERIHDEQNQEYYTFEVDEEKIELQTQSGFFFGETEYDKWYYENNIDTIKIIDNCLLLSGEWEFEYHSSW